MNYFLRRSLAAALLSVGTLLLVIVSADAITYGVPDGNEHPNVGGLVYPHVFSDGTWLYCSGTLISPTVFLTAAHCDIGSSRVTVTFDSAYQDGDKTFTGTWHSMGTTKAIRTTSPLSYSISRLKGSPPRFFQQRARFPICRPISRSQPLVTALTK